jgi:hypothetical protein
LKSWDVVLKLGEATVGFEFETLDSLLKVWAVGLVNEVGMRAALL